MRHPLLRTERQALLNQDRRLFRKPLSNLCHRLSHLAKAMSEACKDIDSLPDDLGEFAAQGLFPADWKLHQHQFEAIEQSQHKHVVITAGTGSGKTESFLIPAVAQLLKESQKWPNFQARDWKWWGSTGRKWQRGNESADRKPAIRTLILYPMNALVEDQMQRLRVALDSDDVRAWLDNHRWRQSVLFWPLHRPNPVSGQEYRERDGKQFLDKSKIQKLRDETKTLSAQCKQLTAKLPTLKRMTNVKLQWKNVPSSRAWMWVAQKCSRAGICTKPSARHPDHQLQHVEHYADAQSGRKDDRENARLIASDPNHIFTLVIDELHMYRGTQGQKSPILSANCCFGWGCGSVLIRCALLPPVRRWKKMKSSRKYLSEIFGVDGSAEFFDIIDGERDLPPGPVTADLSQHAAAFAEFYDSADSQDAIPTLLQNLSLTTNETDYAHQLGDVLHNYIALLNCSTFAKRTAIYALFCWTNWHNNFSETTRNGTKQPTAFSAPSPMPARKCTVVTNARPLLFPQYVGHLRLLQPQLYGGRSTVH